MQLVYSSNRGQSRSFLLDYVRQLKAEHPDTRVLDIGGAYLPWTSEVADAFVDLFPIPGRTVLIGDLNEAPVWSKIREGNFNFCICSHTLEDVRNPVFILSQIKALFTHGYIAMPNKHVEFSHLESTKWIGYGHHRWIYTLTETELRAIAKFPLASFFSPRRRTLGRITTSRPYQLIKKLFEPRGRVGMSDIGYLPWWRADLADRGNELAFIWTGELSYSFINNDYAGHSIQELARLYVDELSEGL